MTEQEYLTVLADRLEIYLTHEDKNYNSTQMINSIITSIIQYFDCDYQKLIDALDELIEMKNSNYSTKYAEEANKFDISNTTKLSVKGFISKGHPVLFFYYNDDPNPYGVVKAVSQDGKDVYSVEISNNSESLSTYKRKDSVLDDSYVFVDEYEYSSEGFRSTKNVYAQAGKSKQLENLDFYNMPEIVDEYKNFVFLLYNAMGKNKADPTNISGFGADILFLSFYDIVKELCGNGNVLTLADIVYFINQTIYDGKGDVKKPDSKIADLVDEVEVSNKALQKRVIFDTEIDGKILRYEVIKSEKYLSIEVYDEGEKICGAMIVASPDGFSLFRTNTKNLMVKDAITSFVINLSDNKIKFVTIDENIKNNESGRNFETIISFDKNGRMKLNSTDVILSKYDDKSPLVVSVQTGFGK